MQKTDTYTISNQSTQLFINSWKGNAVNGKLLLIIHGYGEHSQRYSHVPDYLGDTFERFYAIDLRGHGRSSGLRGYAERFDQYVEDVLFFIQDVQKKEPTKELYLLAHSFGGLVALKMLLKEKKLPFKKIVISAPLLALTVKVPEIKKFLGKALLHVLPKLQFNNEINPNYLSHDPQIVEAYVNDRLVHTKMTPRLYRELNNAMDFVSSNAGPLSLPIMFLIPGHDHVVSSGTALGFYRKLKCRDKQLREYPEMYHEVLNEVDKETVFEDIKKWINS